MHENLNKSVEIRHSQEPKMDHLDTKSTSIEVTDLSLIIDINWATEPIVKQVDRLYTLLSEKNDVISTENRETTGSRRDKNVVKLF